MISRRTPACQYGSRAEFAIIVDRHVAPIDTSSPVGVISVLWQATQFSECVKSDMASCGRRCWDFSPPRALGDAPFVTITDSLLGADHSYVLARPDLKWDAHSVLGGLGAKLTVRDAVEPLLADIVRAAQPGDRVLVMSNGDFGGIHRKLVEALGQKKEGH